MAVLSDKQFLWVAGGAVVAVVAVGWLARKKVVEVAKYVDPTDSENVANQGFEWLHRNLGWGAITGQEEGGLGSWLADLINPPPSPEELNGPVLPAPRYD